VDWTARYKKYDDVFKILKESTASPDIQIKKVDDFIKGNNDISTEINDASALSKENKNQLEPLKSDIEDTLVKLMSLKMSLEDAKKRKEKVIQPDESKTAQVQDNMQEKVEDLTSHYKSYKELPKVVVRDEGSLEKAEQAIIHFENILIKIIFDEDLVGNRNATIEKLKEKSPFDVTREAVKEAVKKNPELKAYLNTLTENLDTYEKAIQENDLQKATKALAYLSKTLSEAVVY